MVCNGVVLVEHLVRGGSGESEDRPLIPSLTALPHAHHDGGLQGRLGEAGEGVKIKLI